MPKSEISLRDRIRAIAAGSDAQQAEPQHTAAASVSAGTPKQSGVQAAPAPQNVQRPHGSAAPQDGHAHFTGQSDARRLFNIALLFYEQHSPPQDTPEYWRRTADDIANLAAANHNSPFLVGLLLAVWDELERESKCAVLQ